MLLLTKEANSEQLNCCLFDKNKKDRVFTRKVKRANQNFVNRKTKQKKNGMGRKHCIARLDKLKTRKKKENVYILNS